MFICPDKNEAEKRMKVLSDLQNILDCVKSKLPVPVQTIPQCYIPVPCIPNCIPNFGLKTKNVQKISEPPEVMVIFIIICYLCILIFKVPLLGVL